MAADSIRIKEIHAALDAGKFSIDENNPESVRVSNLGYYIERIGRILGLSVNPDGTAKSVRQRKVIPDGSVLPDGYFRGQFGTNTAGNGDGQDGGTEGEFRDGIIYEQKCNQLTPDPFNPLESKISGGDLVLCENWIQYLESLQDDLDKALGWQELGAGVVPSADGSGHYATYEGLNTAMAELMYMSSRISMHTSKTLISSKVNQGVAIETLAALGVPTGYKLLTMNVGQDELAKVPYPAIQQDAPTVLQQTFWILKNLSLLVGSLVGDIETKDTAQLKKNKKDS